MSETAPNIYPRSPRDIAIECAQSAQPEVRRFDGQNHFTWTYDLPDDLGYEGDGYEVLMERDDYKDALNTVLTAREEDEGIRRDLIEGSIMPILECDLPAVGLTVKSEEAK